jgi:hypothetical protein
MRAYLLVSMGLTMLSTAASAQITPRPAPLAARLDSTSGTMAGCPGGNGIHISATGGTLGDSASGTNTVIGLSQSVDTTLVFDMSRKTWTRSNIAAAISVGIADESRGRYAICAGVAALIPNATLTITGARGRVHFAASLKDFTNSIRLGPTQ